MYEGRFRDDAIDGQDTRKMSRAMEIPRAMEPDANGSNDSEESTTIS